MKNEFIVIVGFEKAKLWIIGGDSSGVLFKFNLLNNPKEVTKKTKGSKLK